jgi:hypothetical protein
LKLLFGLALLWQLVSAPASAYAGCGGECDPCCALAVAPAACALCLPAALAAGGSGAPRVDAPSRAFPALLRGRKARAAAHDIWRPPRTTAPSLSFEPRNFS